MLPDPVGDTLFNQGRLYRDLISHHYFQVGSITGGGFSRAFRNARTGVAGFHYSGASCQMSSAPNNTFDGTTKSQVPTLIADYNATSITLAVKFNGGGSGNAHMFGIATSSLDRAVLQMTPSTNQFRFNTGSATPTTTGSYFDGKWYTVFGTMAAPVINSIPELWVFDEDGQLVEHVVSGVTQQWGLNNVAMTFFGALGAIGDFDWAGVWHRVLSQSEMSALADNPYQIFEDRQQKWRASVIGGTASQILGPKAGLAPIIARRRQTWLPPTKPQRTDLRLDLAHPLAQGMLVCIPFFEGRGTSVEDQARKTTYSLAGLPSLGPPLSGSLGDDPIRLSNSRISGGTQGVLWASARGQLGAQPVSNTAGWDIGYEGTNLRLPTTAMTVLVGLRLSGNFNRSLFGLESNSALDNSYRLASSLVSGGTINWVVGNTSVGTGVVNQSDQVTYLAFTAGPTGQRIYASYAGLLAASSTAPSRNASRGGVFFLGGGERPITFFALLETEWSEGQVRQWWANPWGWFIAPGQARQYRSIHAFSYRPTFGGGQVARRPGQPLARH